MKYSELVKYFASEESLSRLLDDCQSSFELIDDLAQKLQQNIISTPQEYREALNQATGSFMFLNPIYTTAIATKENEELKFYVQKKRELEKAGEKIVATSLEKEATQSVENYRRIRNILEGYVGSAEKAIGTIQSQLKRLELELSNRNSTLSE